MAAMSSSIPATAPPNSAALPAGETTAPSSVLKVECVLVAEFDIDIGSSLADTYPPDYLQQSVRQVDDKPLDEHLLAELMLPDGAHLRDEDWTVFYLNQRPLKAHSASPAATAMVPTANTSQTRLSQPPSDAPAPMLYCINLCRTKHIDGVKRGARVKAMTICARHPHIHIYKPLLVLALEKYFEQPSPVLLQQLYTAVNSCDTQTIPALSQNEVLILRGGNMAALFPAETGTTSSPNATSSLGRPSNRIVDKDQQAAMAPLGSLSAGLTMSMGRLSSDPKIMYDGVRSHWESRVEFDSIAVPLRVPLDTLQTDVGDFSVAQLVQTFHSPSAKASEPSGLMTILHGLISERRIVFLGHQCAAGDVAKMVLAACSLVAPHLKGCIERSFPYTCLTNLDMMLDVPGFVAGVTNPTYMAHEQWWDIICDIPTGKVKLSPQLNALSGYGWTAGAVESGGAIPEDHDKDVRERELIAYDNEFMKTVLEMIASRQSEMAIRAVFSDYVKNFLQIVCLYEHELVSSSSSYNSSSRRKGQDHGKRSGKMVPSTSLTMSSDLAGRFTGGSIRGKKGVIAMKALAADEATINELASSSPPPPVAGQWPLYEVPGPRAVRVDLAAKRHEFTMFSRRAEAWRNTVNYQHYLQEWQQRTWYRISRLYLDDPKVDIQRPWPWSPSLVDGSSSSNWLSWVDDTDSTVLLGKLRHSTRLTVDDLTFIYDKLLRNASDEFCLQELLVLLPISDAGLNPLCAGIFHHSAIVRQKATKLLLRIRDFKCGQFHVNRMNPFFSITLQRHISRFGTARNSMDAQKRYSTSSRPQTATEKRSGSLSHLLDSSATLASNDSLASYISFEQHSRSSSQDSISNVAEKHYQLSQLVLRSLGSSSGAGNSSSEASQSHNLRPSESGTALLEQSSDTLQQQHQPRLRKHSDDSVTTSSIQTPTTPRAGNVYSRRGLSGERNSIYSSGDSSRDNLHRTETSNSNGSSFAYQSGRPRDSSIPRRPRHDLSAEDTPMDGLSEDTSKMSLSGKS